MEGLYDLIANPKVHFFTFMKSARVGGTLFSIGLVLHKISENPGPILWMDPTRSSARALFRRELEPFMLQCKPVAALAIRDKEHWTASMCFFRGGAFLKLAGSGSPNELSGFQSELVIINEGDKISSSVAAEAPPHEQAAQRTKQFRYTRKIVENSTPTDEFGPTWRRFKRGTQRHCYMPCPHCNRMQRLTFFPEEVEVNFDLKLNPLPAGKVRTERTGKFIFDHCKIKESREVEPGKFEFVDLGWDYDKVLTETQYQCSKGCRIDHGDLNWMLRRYRWIAHNPKAPKDHESAQYWAAYSPFEHWGETAKKFLLAIGDPGAMHDFYNSDLGLPFKAEATEVDELDIQKVVKRNCKVSRSCRIGRLRRSNSIRGECLRFLSSQLGYFQPFKGRFTHALRRKQNTPFPGLRWALNAYLVLVGLLLPNSIQAHH
jgi:phage terminase large subunit GpA-like protein